MCDDLPYLLATVKHADKHGIEVRKHFAMKWMVELG